MRTLEDLKTLQSYPLWLKVKLTKSRIHEWVTEYGTDGVYVSFSGGKDSTVLLHIVREMYPEIEAVFVNTGLEYPEIQTFAKSFDNVTVIRPKMRFDEVIKKYGYPFISKKVSKCVRSFKQGSKWAKSNFEGKHNQTGEPNEYLQNHYGKWKELVNLDFNISDQCCGIMKEKPLNTWCKENGKVHIIGTLAEESVRRTAAWLKTGCNAFDSNRPISKPLSFWTNQDILQYIKENNLPIASVYGDVVYKSKDGKLYDNVLCDCGGKLCTTGCYGTGCIFCGFGAHLDCRGGGESRFVRLKRTHPKQYYYCMGGGGYDSDGLWRPTKEGLGMAHCIDELNKLYSKGDKKFIEY